MKRNHIFDVVTSIEKVLKMDSGKRKRHENYFEILKEKCVTVMKLRNTMSVEVLNKFLETMPDEFVTSLNEYILFPLDVLISAESSSNSDLMISVLNCMSTVFNKTVFVEWMMFNSFLWKITSHLTKYDANSRLVIRASEDTLHVAFQALTQLFDHSARGLWFELYAINNIPIFGNLVSLAVTVISKEKSKKLIETSFLFIKSLFLPKFLDKVGEENKRLLEYRLGELFAGFLPGIVSTVFQVISINPKLEIKVKSVALEVFQELLVIVVSDHAMTLMDDCSLKSSCNESVKGLRQERNGEWIEKLSKNLTLVLSHFTVLANSDSYQLRKGVLDAAIRILKSCASSLEASISALLHVPLSLLHDEHDDIRCSSENIVNYFAVSFEERASASSSSSILSVMLDLQKKLPKALLNVSDLEKIRYLNLLAGYVQVMGPKLAYLPESFYESLVEGILPWFNLEMSGISVFEKMLVSAINYEGTFTEKSVFIKHWIFQKQFAHHNSLSVVKVLIKVCYLLGKHANTMLIFDILMKKYQRPEYSCQAVIIMNEMLYGLHDSDENDFRSASRDMWGLYLKPENWNLCCGSDTYVTPNSQYLCQGDASFTNKIFKSNITLSCLHLEALATISKVSGREFRLSLMDLLYPILEKVLNTHSLISDCAVKALKCFAESCEYESVADLINNNADYLISNISIQLQQTLHYPQSPAVLQAMLLNSNADTYPYIKNTIEEIVSQLDEHWDDEPILLCFLKLLLTITQCIKRWFSQKQLLDSESSPQQTEVAPSNAMDVVTNVLSFQKSFDDLKLNYEEEDVDEPVEEEEKKKGTHENDVPFPSDGENNKAPGYIEVLLLICNRCCNLISYRAPYIQLKVMDIISESVEIIAQHEDSFLPFVHKVWDPLCDRVTDCFPVVIKAYDLIHIISWQAKDFVRSRFMKTVFPKLLYHITTQQHVYGRSTVTLRQSFRFKLLVRIFTTLGKILTRCQVQLNHYRQLCHKSVIFLASNRPLEYQEAALELFKDLAAINPDFIWLTLNSVYCPHTVFKSCASPKVYYSIGPTSDNKYSKNITKLLKALT